MKILAPKPTDPSALVVPFGKHKGVTVAELLAIDPEYAQWITGQGWVAERFAELHAAILTRGAGNDDSPEHNALQARFLDHAFRAACLRLAMPNGLRIGIENLIEGQTAVESGEVYKAERYGLSAERVQKAKNALAIAQSKTTSPKLFTTVRFEQNGVDVLIEWIWSKDEPDRRFSFYGNSCGGRVAIELKPGFGDDYPTVMRQMHRLGCKILVAQTFSGRGVSEPVLKAMMEANGYVLIFEREIEAEMIAGGERP